MSSPTQQTSQAADEVGAGALLCVDMDGTLVASDTLWESVLLLVKRRPADLLALLGWLGRGKAYVKQQVALRVVPDAVLLPYRPEVLAFLKGERARGRRVMLTTAADERIAHAVADHLKLFDAVLASDGQTNLSSNNKLNAIRREAGEAGFDYVGNSDADLVLLQQAKRAYLVGAGPKLQGRARQVCEPRELCEPPRGALRPILQALRPHQWVKNLLVFLPLLLAHDLRRWPAALVAFVSFSLCASAVYVLNDLLDIESDRHHAAKRDRPFAAGTLPVKFGPVLIVGLLLAAFSVALSALPPAFAGMLALYLALTTAYSMYFKRRLLVDVFVLAALYTQRVLSGGVAASVPVTPWLLAFSMFFFLSLAFAKRYTELMAALDNEQEQLRGRNYGVEDIGVIESVGPTSGYMAVLVLALYINSEKVSALYERPFLLWLVCPIILYWITRVWFFARRRALAEDPVLFALKDRISFIAMALVALLVFLAAVRLKG